jgi:hypothetical protein
LKVEARLDHLAFQAVDHSPDLELARSPAEAVHKSDRLPDREAACLVGPERAEMADRATDRASVALGHSDLGPRKRSCRLLIMLQAPGACASLLERRTMEEVEGLFHPAAVKIALVRCVLLDVGSLALLGSILRFRMFQKIIGKSFGFAAGPLIASISGRNLRHVLGHFDSPDKYFRIDSSVT